MIFDDEKTKRLHMIKIRFTKDRLLLNEKKIISWIHSIQMVYEEMSMGQKKLVIGLYHKKDVDDSGYILKMQRL